jgi:hypothetical protein
MAPSSFITLFAATWLDGSHSRSGNACLDSVAAQLQSHMLRWMLCNLFPVRGWFVAMGKLQSFFSLSNSMAGAVFMTVAKPHS